MCILKTPAAGHRRTPRNYDVWTAKGGAIILWKTRGKSRNILEEKSEGAAWKLFPKMWKWNKKA